MSFFLSRALFFSSASLAYLYSLTILISLIRRITLTIRVTRLALEVYTICAAFPASGVVPSPVIISQSQPISGIIETVEIMSNQKKKVKKYSSLHNELKSISMEKIIMHATVIP